MPGASHSAGLVLLAGFVLANPARGAERVSSPRDWMLSFKGFGPVRVGMTVREAEKALKMKLQEDAAAESEPEGCHHASNDAALPGVSFMVEGGKIVRIEINAGDYRSAGGVRIGMTEQDVKKRHPNIKSQEHHYDPSGHYLSLQSEDHRYGIVFETDGKWLRTSGAENESQSGTSKVACSQSEGPAPLAVYTRLDVTSPR